MYMKYIRLEGSGIILFSGHLKHKDVAARWSSPADEVISAGQFGCLDGETLVAFGESTSIGVKSRPEDTRIILAMLGK